eukprot:TRINITY_DN29143_c0_g1_i1.p1 TRINITY_DN29143_c0_g1~~TRINITY_DN29143_c0_g1_i1.p1  ORF type:complete len:654 (-),score=150.78 TRINITY_DN29143_c0_g1_i1:37-1974(-)
MMRGDLVFAVLFGQAGSVQLWPQNQTAPYLYDGSLTDSVFVVVFVGKARRVAMSGGYNDGGGPAFGRRSSCGRHFGPPDDQFVIGKRLGKGGQGTVYECTKSSGGGQTLAVKLVDLTKPAYVNLKGKNNLRREINIMRQLFHPRIVNLHDAFWAESECFIVMDLACGGDLHTKIEREAEDSEDDVFKGLGGAEEASRNVTRQLLDGIAYMHSHGISHRDMKLENVLITGSKPFVRSASASLPDGEAAPEELLEVKIADLGLSREMDDGPVKMATMVGTPDFVAPEVLEQNYDQRADLWSLGVMVYAMLCGAFPFSLKMADLKPERHKQVVSQVKSCKPWEAASADAKAVVQGLLTIDPGQRLSVEACLESEWLGTKTASPANTPKFRSTSDVEVRGAVKKLCGSEGSFVDLIELHLRDGAKELHGRPGGYTHCSHVLESGELLIGLLQETGDMYLGSSFVFFTSFGRTLSIKGNQANRRRTFVAPAESEIAGLHFDGSELSGIFLKETAGEGSVESIGGQVGHAVDSLQLRLRNGQTRSYGSSGGQAQGPWSLEPGEYVRVVDQSMRDAFLGNSLVFLTSTGRIIRLRGLQSDRVRVFMAPAGQQLCGMQMQGSRVDRVQTCPESGDLSQAETHMVLNSDDKPVH